MAAPFQRGADDVASRREHPAGAGRRTAGGSDLRPDVRRARIDLRRHAGHQFRAGRFHDARHVCRVLPVPVGGHPGRIRQCHRAVRGYPAVRSAAVPVRLLDPPVPDFARYRAAHRAA